MLTGTGCLTSLTLLQIVVEGPTGIKLRETADKVIGLKQELATLKQAQKAQGSTQDSLRAAVSALDKQVQVLPSTLAKQIAQPAEDVNLPRTKSGAILQRQPTEVQPVADVTEKQMSQWTGVLDQVHPDDNEPAHVRLAKLNRQQQQVPLTRQLIVEPTAPVVQPQQAQPAVAPPAEPTPPPSVIVQVCSRLSCNKSLLLRQLLLLRPQRMPGCD